MVAFREVTKNNQKYLVTVHSSDDADQSGFKLVVHPPMSGSRSSGLTQSNDKAAPLYSELKRNRGPLAYLLSPLTKSTEPRSTTFNTLGRRIISGEVQWGTVLKTSGVFNYTERYWEWLEDILCRSRSVLKKNGLYDALSASLFTYSKCPSVIRAFCEAWCPETNTIHTDAGEMSISLWDLWHVGGLPVTGDLYEEVIPSVEELTASGAQQKTASLPPSCQHLFTAYLHCLDGVYDHENPKVPLSRWIDFWCKQPTVYKKPIPKKSGASRPKDSQNPSGVIATEPRQWSKKDKELFARLRIDEKSEEESFLAAFIACWLCLFALPSNDATIRPSTFKMASLIAHGRSHCLAVPVLASMYRGLNIIARSFTPEHGDACLPWHYIIGWIALYFNTHHKAPSSLPGPAMVSYSGVGGAKDINDHKGRDLIHRARDVPWWMFVPRREKTEFKVDDGRLSVRDQAFILSARSSFLVLHQGERCISEPYNPYRFARQFGFYQAVPKELPNSGRRVTVEEGKQLWETYFTPKSRLRMVFPENPKDYHRHSSFNFSEWWSKVHGSYLLDGRSLLTATVNRGTTKAKQVPTVVKIKNVELPQPRKEPITSDPPRAPKPVEKHREPHVDSKEKRHREAAAVASESSSPSERNWKRTRVTEKQVIPYSLEDNDINWSNFFDGVPSLGNLSTNFSRILENEPLYVANIPQQSERSTNGPDAFSLEARKIGKTLTPSKEVNSGGVIIPAKPPRKGKHIDADFVPPVEFTAESGTEIIDGDTEPGGQDVDGGLPRALSVSGERVTPVFLASHPKQAEVSEFRSRDVISKCRRHYLIMLWEPIRDKISRCSIEKLASIKDEVYKVFSEMENTKASDLSHLKTLLDTTFKNAAHYGAALEDVSNRLPEEKHDEKLSILSEDLVEAEKAEKEHIQRAQSYQAKLVKIQGRREELRKELATLQNEEDEIASSLRDFDEGLKGLSARVSQLNEDIRDLENTPSLQPEEIDVLRKMKELLEDSRRDLEDFNLFP